MKESRIYGWADSSWADVMVGDGGISLLIAT